MSRPMRDSPSALSDGDQLRREQLRRRGYHIVLYILKWQVLDFRIGRLHGDDT